MPTDSESATLLARSRLATLTAHLLPFNNQPADHLLPHRLSAQLPAANANLNGTLTIVDERTGKKYQVEVSQDGTVKATDFKKVVKLCFFMITNQSFIFCFRFVKNFEFFKMGLC
jgi:citrate synthase